VWFAENSLRREQLLNEPESAFSRACWFAGIEIFLCDQWFLALMNNGEKPCFWGLRLFALGQSSFFAFVQPLIAIDRH